MGARRSRATRWESAGSKTPPSPRETFAVRVEHLPAEESAHGVNTEMVAYKLMRIPLMMSIYLRMLAREIKSAFFN